MPPKTRTATSKAKSTKSSNKKTPILTPKDKKKVLNAPPINQSTPLGPEVKVYPKRLLSKPSNDEKENVSSNITPKKTPKTKKATVSDEKENVSSNITPKKTPPKTKKLEKSTSPKQRTSISKSIATRRSPRSLSSYHSRRLSYNLRPSMCNSRNDATPVSRSLSRVANSSEVSSRRSRSSYGNRSGNSILLNSTTVLNTPFTKKNKRIYNPAEITNKSSPTSNAKVSPNQKVQWGQEMDEWVGRQWRVTIMNSLFNFDFSSPNLVKMYQNTLRDLLSSSSIFDISVKISRCGCFSRVTDAVDYISIKVSYSIPKDWDGEKDKGSPGKKKVPGDVKLLYRAMLVSRDFLKGTPNVTGEFPVVLHSGTKRIQMTVVDWLQDSFGGSVARHSLSNLAMVWGLALSSKTFLNEHKEKKGVVDLQFLLDNLSADGWQYHRVHAPSKEVCKKIKDLSFIKMKMECMQLSKITKCILSEEATQGVTTKERDIFYGVLQSLLEDTTMLPKESFRLIKISTPCLTLLRTGMIKMSCRKHIAAYIKWILEMQQDDSCYQIMNPDEEEDEEGSDVE